MAASKSTVNTVTALSTRTIAWWSFKRIAPGSALTLGAIYLLPLAYR